MQVGSGASNIQFIGTGSGTAAKVNATTEGFSFWDVLDVINPLQHIPILSSLYRAVSGDTIGAAANIAGATLFGGPIGGGLAAASEIVKEAVGGESETQTALADSQKATQAYSKMRVTTQDWLNPNFGSESQLA